MAEIIVALDLPSGSAALGLVDELGGAVDFYKVGSPLFTRSGPSIVRELRARGKRVFLDLKYHDIPNAVARAVQAAANLDVELLTVHASGGTAMMRAAAEAAGSDGPRLLGVTILTSFTPVEVEEVWNKQILSLRDEVGRLAALAAEAGLHGIVASPLEAETMKRRHGAEFLVVTPGIRPAGEASADQARTSTPGAAAKAGADYLVIGRPILEAEDRVDVLERIMAEVAAGAQVVE
ncbi:MAG: orotidine-5'-phosphate decarboxylase [Longimicrobiales bacterium]